MSKGRYDMELIEGDVGIEQVLGDALDEGGRDVDAHRAKLVRHRPVPVEMLSQPLTGFGAPARGSKHHLALVGIGGDNSIVVPVTVGGFVANQHHHHGQIGHGQFHVSVANRIHRIPGFAHRRKGHLLSKRQHGSINKCETGEHSARPDLTHAPRSSCNLTRDAHFDIALHPSADYQVAQKP